MKPLFFNPHDGRNPCREKSLGLGYRLFPESVIAYFDIREGRERYERNAPFGAGVVGGSAVLSEVLTRRQVTERPGPIVTSQQVEVSPGRRVTTTTQRLEIVTTVTTLTSVVTGGGRSPERAQPKASE